MKNSRYSARSSRRSLLRSSLFVGALLFDYQIERTHAKRFRRFKLLLVAELSETLEVLDPANAVKVQLSDNSSAEVVTTYVQPVILEQAVRDGFFDPSNAKAATRLAGKYVVTASKSPTSSPFCL